MEVAASKTKERAVHFVSFSLPFPEPACCQLNFVLVNFPSFPPLPRSPLKVSHIPILNNLRDEPVVLLHLIIILSSSSCGGGSIAQATTAYVDEWRRWCFEPLQPIPCTHMVWSWFWRAMRIIFIVCRSQIKGEIPKPFSHSAARRLEDSFMNCPAVDGWSVGVERKKSFRNSVLPLFSAAFSISCWL